MPRFFIKASQVNQNIATILGDDARHIALSLRMAVNDMITLCDMQGCIYNCHISEITESYVKASVLSISQNFTEPTYSAHLFQALIKGDKFDVVVQKAVETGVNEITPFISERCIAKLDDSSAQKKFTRWNRIALEAAKQCGRGIIPKVNPPIQFIEAMKNAGSHDIALFCYEGDNTQPLGKCLSSRAGKLSPEADKLAPETDKLSISIVIGAEGGFSLDEANLARNSKMLVCGLGKRILRTESASAFVLACISYQYELQ